MLPEPDLVRKLQRSKIFRDYEEAFQNATELPLALQPAEIWNMALHGSPRENPFCALLADSSKACAQCLRNQEVICDPASLSAKSAKCFAGLYDTAVPVRQGEKVIGFLQTGQIAFEKPSAAKFEKVAKQLLAWGATVDLTKLQEAYFHSRVLSKTQYQAMVRLLEIFAGHLSEIANQIALEESEKEPLLVRRARAYIGDHSGEPLHLTQLAEALHVSTFYFCKMFKKATGLTFTDYLGRVRVEKAKALLLHADLRVSEIAYEVGFESLTHFNRLFRRVTGQSPTAFRQSAHTL